MFLVIAASSKGGKNTIEILIEIALNLWIYLVKIDISTILSLPIEV